MLIATKYRPSTRLTATGGIAVVGLGVSLFGFGGLWLGKSGEPIQAPASQVKASLTTSHPPDAPKSTATSSRSAPVRVNPATAGDPFTTAQTPSQPAVPADEPDRALPVSEDPRPSPFPDTPVGQLLQEHWELMMATGENAEADYQESLERLREHAEEAIDLLFDAYQVAMEEDYGLRWALTYTIGAIQTHQSVPLLREIALAPIPEERWPDSHHGSSQGEEAMIRMAASNALAKLAKKGNTQAESTLLELMAHEDFSTRRTAVQGYLNAGPDRSHRVAEAKTHLAQEDHWLLRLVPADIKRMPQPQPSPEPGNAPPSDNKQTTPSPTLP